MLADHAVSSDLKSAIRQSSVRLRNRNKGPAHDAATVPYTVCIAELPDPVSEVTAFKLTGVILNKGHYFISNRNDTSEAIEGLSHKALPKGVMDLLKPAQPGIDHSCFLQDNRRVVLLDIWPGDFNTYHNMIFYVRQFVKSVIDAWGPDAFKDRKHPLYYGFFSPTGDQINHKASNLRVYKSLEVFFSGAFLDVVNQDQNPCVVLKNVLLTPKVHYYSRMYNTQHGVARDAEMQVYSLMREMYVRKYVGNTPGAFSAAENAQIKILYLGRPRDNSRYILNEEELLIGMNATFGNMKGVEISIRHDFGALSFEEQINVAANSDIMIGPHGAGMTHVLFLKPQSVLIELIPNGWADPGYRNLAIFSEKTYLFWQQTNESLSEDTTMRDGKLVHLGRSNNFAVHVNEVMDLLGTAVKIVSMVGSRYWPDCPGHEFLNYLRAMPIRCARLWKRDEGIKGDTPLDRMLRS
ncbi:MAG: hypothetical protein MMC33_010664 [Icmadophila ericetorum]|nr:hypothetical protein [Icmadophila ericetorum]